MRPVFAAHATLRAVVDAAVESGLGRAFAWGAPPRAARLAIGCYEIFGGEADPEAAAALAAGVRDPCELVFGNDPGWRGLLGRLFPAAFDRPMRDFDPEGLSPGLLAATASALPPGAALVPFDADLAAQLDGELSPHALQVFDSAEDFLRRGLGFAVVAGGRLACAATTYGIAPRAAEIAIATRPAFRGRGFAAAAAARLLLECLRRGLAPGWNASNPISQRLAARLGYRPAGPCEVLYLPAASG